MASLAATRAYWMKGSRRRASLRSMCWPGSKPRTSPRKIDAQIAGVETRDVVDARVPGDQLRPGLVHGQPQRRERADAGDHDTTRGAAIAGCVGGSWCLHSCVHPLCTDVVRPHQWLTLAKITKRGTRSAIESCGENSSGRRGNFWVGQGGAACRPPCPANASTCRPRRRSDSAGSGAVVWCDGGQLTGASGSAAAPDRRRRR